jgi:hypothetical protein
MDLKFYLNKFVKIDNIEGYTLSSLRTIEENYSAFMEKTDGLDPDFPTIDFGGKKGKKGKKIQGQNKAKLELGEE